MILTDDYLDKMRSQGDPVADRTLKMVLKTKKLRQANQIFAALVRNDDLEDYADTTLGAYFEETAVLPDNIDQEKVKLAQEVFLRFGPTVFLILFAQSLPECYACWRGAKVLYKTGKMTNSGDEFKVYSRRLMETAQFVVNVMEPGGMEAHGDGLITAQKVRLIHAAIRHFILADEWDQETYGLPINQEDKLGTLLSFSVTILQGLDKMGIDLTEEEKDAYYYHWTIVGRMMGVRPELIPETLAEAVEVKAQILRRQIGPSEEGKTLARVAAEYMAHVTPGKLFDSFATGLMEFLVDEDVAEALGLQEKKGFGQKVAMAALRVMGEFQEHFGRTALFRNAAQAFEVRLLESIFRQYNDKKAISFYIPPSFQGEWGLTAAETAASRAPAVVSTFELQANDANDVVPQLERMIKRCRMENDPAGFFASLYRMTTIRILRAVDRGDFEDNERMARMDHIFASRYLDAANAYYAGQRTTSAWDVAFTAAGNKDLTVLQHLLLGMNAHINLDLPIAAAETAPGDAIKDFNKDFRKINGILKSLFDITERDLSEIWTPLKVLLVPGDGIANMLVSIAMVRERKKAWRKAVRLAHREDEKYTKTIERIDRRTTKVAYDIIDPGSIAEKLMAMIRRQERGTVRTQIEQFQNQV